MKRENAGFPRTFRLSGVLLLIGLATEAISLFWVHPIAFLLFILIGGTLLLAGVLLFLFSLTYSFPASDIQDSEGNKTPSGSVA